MHVVGIKFALPFAVLLFTTSLFAEEKPPYIWIASKGSPRSISILVHGLNEKPSTMDSIGKILEGRGSEVLRVALTGHRGDRGTFAKVTRTRWLKDLKAAYDVAEARAANLHLPLYYVGFSLGALLGLDLLTSSNKVHYDKMVLFAPPIETRIPRWFVRCVGSVFGPNFEIHSFGSKERRAHRATPVAAYLAAVNSMSNLEKNGLSRANIPTLVVIDPDDEVVKYSKILSVIKQYQLKNWQVLEVNHRHTLLPSIWYHGVQNEPALGMTEWAKVSLHIQALVD